LHLQKKEPVVSRVFREEKDIRVEPGMVAECRQRGYGLRKGEVVIEMEHSHTENIRTGDYIQIFGTPDIQGNIRPEIPGGIGSIAIMINMISQVINAVSGLHTMLDLPLPLTYMCHMVELIRKDNS